MIKFIQIDWGPIPFKTLDALKNHNGFKSLLRNNG